jgi:hypothetical protein
LPCCCAGHASIARRRARQPFRWADKRREPKRLGHRRGLGGTRLGSRDRRVIGDAHRAQGGAGLKERRPGEKQGRDAAGGAAGAKGRAGVEGI